jgi:hypothetical protein
MPSFGQMSSSNSNACTALGSESVRGSPLRVTYGGNGDVEQLVGQRQVGHVVVHELGTSAFKASSRQGRWMPVCLWEYARVHVCVCAGGVEGWRGRGAGGCPAEHRSSNFQVSQ